MSQRGARRDQKPQAGTLRVRTAARLAGWTAGYDGIGWRDCPHRFGSARYAWLLGWTQGRFAGRADGVKFKRLRSDLRNRA